MLLASVFHYFGYPSDISVENTVWKTPSRPA